MSGLSARAKRAAQRWWSEGWYEGHALAIAVGIPTSLIGFVNVLWPSILLIWYGNTILQFVVIPLSVAAVAIYIGGSLTFSAPGLIRYAMLAMCLVFWLWTLWQYLEETLNPSVLTAYPVAQIVLCIIALIRARAWLPHRSRKRLETRGA